MFASPLLAPDALLRHFPPCFVHVGQVDPLLDDSLSFLDRLRKADPARACDKLLVIPGVSHAYLHVTKLLPEGRESRYATFPSAPFVAQDQCSALGGFSPLTILYFSAVFLHVTPRFMVFRFHPGMLALDTTISYLDTILNVLPLPAPPLALAPVLEDASSSVGAGASSNSNNRPAERQQCQHQHQQPPARDLGLVEAFFASDSAREDDGADADVSASSTREPAKFFAPAATHLASRL